MHLKRQKVPTKWPITRKGTKYVVRSNFNINEGVPLLVLLRDMLKIAENRKEVKKALHNKYILLNDKLVKDEKNTVSLFDKVGIIPQQKYYELNLSELGKFKAEEIPELESHQKISKIINKKVLKGKKTQLNLSDGRNLLNDSNCEVNDSAIINFKDKKIKKFLPLKEKSNVIVIAGKHTGKKGKISKIENEKKMAEFEIDGKKINVLIKQIMVVE
jgi:small subunit ribosomal protein S4e